MTRPALFKYFFPGLCCTLVSLLAASQSILGRSISIDINRQRLDNTLEIISNKGNFYLSYNSSIVKRDSLVSISASNKPVQEVLASLLGSGFEFRESGNYLIIRRMPVKLKLVTNKGATEEKQYTVTGYVLDDLTGEQLANASIYERNLLVSALTNEEGYFRIRLKSKGPTAALTVSKQFYQDTTVVIEPRYNQQLTITILPEQGPMITISPDDYFVPDSLRVRAQTPAGTEEHSNVSADSGNVEMTMLGMLLISSRQKLQSLNLGQFFTDRPFQASVIPGVSTQGKLSGQVVHHLSLNLFGGYTGGVNGLEVGGLFNINQKHVQYAQFAGLFNVVGGRVSGVQMAGLSNTVLQSVQGVQVAGISNLARNKFGGLQLGGVYNHVSGTVNGIQLAGVSNYAKEKIKGIQLSGIANIANRGIDGMQVGAVFNYAKTLKGTQIGLINIADSSHGYSIGLINVVLHGYHKLSFSTNEVLNTNLAFKTGNRRLYSILGAGANVRENERAYSFGYGMGSEWQLGNRISITPEFTGHYIYLGNWNDVNLMARAQLNLLIHLGKYVSLFGGPVATAYYTNQLTPTHGYLQQLPPAGFKTYGLEKNTTGWIGWNAGINFF